MRAPVLFPSNVQEYLDFGLHGWAISCYSGLWVAMKCVTDVVESSASVDIDPHRTKIVIPTDFAMPDGGRTSAGPIRRSCRKRVCSTTSGTPR